MSATQRSAPQQGAASGLPACREFTWKSHDGLTLSGCSWLPGNVNAAEENIPVLCLPGLSRNVRDFKDIAAFLQHRGHCVHALDYRGRGKSDWDQDWSNYSIPVEARDIDAAIDMLGLKRFVLLGTSRGGLHALTMAEKYPKSRMAGVIFNDIGPHIEMPAIHRITESIGRDMELGSDEDAARNELARRLGPQFPEFGPDDWDKLVRQLASHRDGTLVLDYDPAIAHQFAALAESSSAPELWNEFQNLTDRPVLVLRGEHSDLLSPETCRRMLEMHSGADLQMVAGQGHAPVLWDSETQEVIARFLRKF
ncbi:alpha/beta hydrolase [Rhodobacterales bacterium]|nr:alpha/beta hydrolase [Rhodobacterales bacterium]